MPDIHNSRELQNDTVSPEEGQIVDQIFAAVLDRRLQPGTKLSEAALCEAFNVGRMRIRRSLLILASREVVEIISNRGAYIATPTAKQARDVFEARQAIEPNVVRLAVQRKTAADVKSLEQHLQKENIAHETGNRNDAIRLSGEFHIMLASIADNSVMLRSIKELVARASLIIGMYGAPGVTSCRDDDHVTLLDAFKKGKDELAAKLMSEHLTIIQSNIDLDKRVESSVDLKQLFSHS